MMNKITILFFLIFLTSTLFLHSGEKKIWAKSFLGKKAPALHVEGWISEKPKIEKGKFILIDFWATWCGPCKRAIPELNEFKKEFKDKLIVIGISDESKEKIQAMKSPAIEYYSAFDTKAKMKKTYKVKGIPHVVIISPKGIVVWEGFPHLTGHELTKDVIKKLIEKKAEKK